MAPLETRAEGKVVFDLAFTRYRGQRIEDLVVRFDGEGDPGGGEDGL